MKFVKFGIFALSMGLFVASCGESTTEEAVQEEVIVPEEVVTPEPTPEAAAVVDTIAAAVDSTAAAVTE